MYHPDQPPFHQEGEETIFFLRRHFFILLKHILLYASLAAFPIAAVLFLRWRESSLIEHDLSRALLYLFVFAYYLYIWLFFYRGFLDYYLDVWVVTTKRIISIEQKGLFNRVIAEQKISRLQDVTSHCLLYTSPSPRD